MDWEAFLADLHRHRAVVARWERQAYAAIITGAALGVGLTALTAALQGLPA